jgi:predicted flap endonuclease-1-like 5' DNA nuclease
MTIERQGKTIIAILFLVAAGFLATEQAVQAAPVQDWGQPVTFGLIALAFILWGVMEDRTSRIFQPEVVRAESANGAAQVETVSVDPDDLTQIEGIGPKMSNALIAAGITTFAQLARTPETELRAAVEAAGMRLAPSLPTWAEQASFAAGGSWAGLDDLQAELKGGRRA